VFLEHLQGTFTGIGICFVGLSISSESFSLAREGIFLALSKGVSASDMDIYLRTAFHGLLRGSFGGVIDIELCA